MRGIEASWSFSGDPARGPLRHGALVLDGATIVDAGPAHDLRARHPGASWESHEGLIAPGLVNARISLELCALEGLAQPNGAIELMRTIAGARSSLEPELVERAIARAVDALARGGTAAIGLVTSALDPRALAVAPFFARIYREVAGVERETASVMRELAREEIEGVPFDVALAPHSSIGLHPDAIASICAGARAPIQMPLSFSREEREYLEEGTGAFAEWMREIDAEAPEWAGSGLAPIDHAGSIGVLGPGLACTHLCDARPHELRALAATRTRIVLCPRSSLFVERTLPPLFDVLEAGLEPGLGTDSLATAPSVDVLEEAIVLRRRFHTVPAAQLFAMATSYGAAALGLEREVGSFAPGLAPGVLLFALGGVDEPLERALDDTSVTRRMLAPPGKA
jgi:aminodeoxyfutalosine deaminase